MKTVIDFINEAKHNFLIKGHTKSQENINFSIEKSIDNIFKHHFVFELTNKITGFDVYTAKAKLKNAYLNKCYDILTKQFPKLYIDYNDKSKVLQIFETKNAKKPLYVLINHLDIIIILKFIDISK